MLITENWLTLACLLPQSVVFVGVELLRQVEEEQEQQIEVGGGCAAEKCSVVHQVTSGKMKHSVAFSQAADSFFFAKKNLLST